MGMDESEARRLNKAKQRSVKWEERKERSKLSRQEIELLQLKRADLRRKLEEKEEDPDRANTVGDDADLHFESFTDLPLSQRTAMGIERGHYKKMTPIQCDSLHLALAGFDVLGAAKTGSGKTLCFVIPVLEQLFLQHWSADMGVGAIILTPTRELALQIFKVMQLVGYKHVLSAALLTGGRDVEEEKKRLHAISIMIGTPGRILHHLEDNAELVLDNLQILCMDEADRLLDLGFRDTISNILKYLPTDRQTLLFSATQTTDVQMLAQVSLKNPKYVTSHSMSKAPTPSTLCQNFLVVNLERKLDALLVFLKKHPSDKIVIFASTCNQVKYMYLAFSKILKKMRIPSMCLTSKMKQFRREEVFMTFCRCKAAALFCTDVAARGLDFPLVHWVVQYDCPDSAQTYIHRVGRTARAGARGAAILFLTPRETPFLSYLAHKNVPMREIAFRPDVLQVSRDIFVALVVQGLKYEAQKAFIAYIRGVYFSSNKHVFDVKSIDLEAFARSLGLPAVPDMSDMDFRRSAKNLPWDVVNYLTAKDEKRAGLTRKEKHLQASDLFRQQQQQRKYAPKTDDSDGDEDDFLVKKVESTENSSGGLSAQERMAGLSKHKIRKYIETADLRVRDLGLSKRIVFDSDDDDSGKEDRPADITVASLSSVTRGHTAEEGADATDSASETHYADQLRDAVLRSKASDAERAKQLRRLRKLQKMGKVSKKTKLEEIAATSGGSRPKKDNDEAEEDEYSASSDEEDSDDSLADLVRLATDKGEGDDDAAEAYHGMDSDSELDEAPRRWWGCWHSVVPVASSRGGDFSTRHTQTHTQMSIFQSNTV
eukprot:gene8283-5802_t